MIIQLKAFQPGTTESGRGSLLLGLPCAQCSGQSTHGLQRCQQDPPHHDKAAPHVAKCPPEPDRLQLRAAGLLWALLAPELPPHTLQFQY